MMAGGIDGNAGEGEGGGGIKEAFGSQRFAAGPNERPAHTLHILFFWRQQMKFR